MHEFPTATDRHKNNERAPLATVATVRTPGARVQVLCIDKVATRMVANAVEIEGNIMSSECVVLTHVRAKLNGCVDCDKYKYNYARNVQN